MGVSDVDQEGCCYVSHREDDEHTLEYRVIGDQS